MIKVYLILERELVFLGVECDLLWAALRVKRYLLSKFIAQLYLIFVGEYICLLLSLRVAYAQTLLWCNLSRHSVIVQITKMFLRALLRNQVQLIYHTRSNIIDIRAQSSFSLSSELKILRFFIEHCHDTKLSRCFIYAYTLL